MDSGEELGQALARRLRELRESHWPETKITQQQLATALGGDRPLSVPLISSWESSTSPKLPPIHRLEAYATLFASRRSADGESLRLLRVSDLTDSERRAHDELKAELLKLRKKVLLEGNIAGASHFPDALDTGPWHFEDGKPITIVCAQLPEEMLARMPYANPTSPDYVELYTYADLDALFELHGHVRAANPSSQVNLRVAPSMVRDDYTAHLIALGGVDWNTATRSVLSRLHLPVRQIADWSLPEGPYFEVDQAKEKRRHHPRLDGDSLLEDVALFARGPNPFNKNRTVTICNGMYGHGTYGAVRALTDARFRDRNAEYLRGRFPNQEFFSILTRVTVENSTALTPDWTIAENRLHEWPEPRS